METVNCPTCARPCRRDRTDAEGRLVCTACATVFKPGQATGNATVSLGGVASDADSPPPTPTEVHVAASLPRAGLNVSVTLAPDTAPPTTSALSQRNRPVTELLHSTRKEGKYVVDGELGRGGMGVVLRVVDRDLHRDVAMKVLLNDSRDRDRRRFVEEAQITGQLEHPNIVPVHDLGVDTDGRLFFTMKLVRGRSLADVLELLLRDPAQVPDFTRFRLLRIFIQVCNAVAFAHARGVVHRDLKPSNIMLGDYGEVLVADWGLGRVLPPERRTVMTDAGRITPATIQAAAPAPAPAEQDDRLAQMVRSFRRNPDGSSHGETVQGTVEGTPAYMPPEQARGELDHIDERSDVYSLGAILYEILTLHPPVGGRSIDEVLDNVINHRIPPPGARAPERDIPLELSAICLKALSSEKTYRYQRAIDLRRDIEAHLEHRSVSAKDDSAFDMLVKALRRNRTAALTALVAMAILAVVLSVSFRAIRHERDTARENARKAADSVLELRAAQVNREADQKRAAPALVAKARAAASTKDWMTAREDVELALRYDHELAESHLLRAQLKVRDREFDAALRELEQYLRINPDDEDARRLAGLCAQAGDEPTSALISAIADVLVRQGMGSLAEDLFNTSRERVLVYKKQLERAWPGSTASGFSSDKDGMLTILGLADRQDVSDLTPLAGMPVVKLRLNRTKVIDLGPLKGMLLTDLDLNGTQVRDLTPLAGSPLTSLQLVGTHVTDLSPLSGMPLEDLMISGTEVANLEPLRNAPLRTLTAVNTKVVDISPLCGAPLHALNLADSPVADLSALSGSRLSSFSLSGTRVEDLTPLAGLPLTRLELERTRITNLTAIQGMPLRQIRISATQIADLIPLTGMALTELDLSGLPVADLSPLAGMPLASLTITGTQVTGLEALRKLRLTTLTMADTKIRDLAPLKGLPLTRLDLSRVPAADLSPLAGSPLNTLILDGTAVIDLRPLKGMPLRELRLASTRITDITPILGCPLERLILPAQPPQGWRDLRSLATLKQVGSTWDSSWGRVPSAAEFLRRLDEQGPR